MTHSVIGNLRVLELRGISFRVFMPTSLAYDRDRRYLDDGSVEIVCENRIQLQGSPLPAALRASHQDVEGGIVQWDFSHPYFIASGEDGYSHHMDRQHLSCTPPGNRPVPCRAYDCRNDKRILQDLEQRIVSPDLEKLFRAERRTRPKES